jgi:hypothetical protein
MTAVIAQQTGNTVRFRKPSGIYKKYCSTPTKLSNGIADKNMAYPLVGSFPVA